MCTDSYSYRTTTVTLAAHARRGLIIMFVFQILPTLLVSTSVLSMSTSELDSEEDEDYEEVRLASMRGESTISAQED